MPTTSATRPAARATDADARRTSASPAAARTLASVIRHRAGRCRALHRTRQRVVPARIQDHQPQRCARGRYQQVVDRDRLEAHVHVAFQARIHRDQVVDAVHLDAVARVEHQRHIRAGAPPRERAQRFGQLPPIGVELGGHLEPEPPQRGRHVGRVVVRVRQPPDVCVGAVAHHQRHASIGERDRRHRDHDERQNKPRRATAQLASRATPSLHSPRSGCRFTARCRAPRRPGAASPRVGCQSRIAVQVRTRTLFITFTESVPGKRLRPRFRPPLRSIKKTSVNRKPNSRTPRIVISWTVGSEAPGTPPNESRAPSTVVFTSFQAVSKRGKGLVRRSWGSRRADRADAGAEARGPGVPSPRERAPVAVRPGAFDGGLSSRCVPGLRAGAVDVVSDGAGGALCGFGGGAGV